MDDIPLRRVSKEENEQDRIRHVLDAINRKTILEAVLRIQPGDEFPSLNVIIGSISFIETESDMESRRFIEASVPLEDYLQGMSYATQATVPVRTII